MALESQQRIVAYHATAVVGDLDQLFATGFNLNPMRVCARHRANSEHFLGHRSRALYHFAGSDLVSDVFGKTWILPMVVASVIRSQCRR